MSSPTWSRTRVIAVSGAPGAGKTETARYIRDLYPGRIALIDIDAVTEVGPWRVDESLYELAEHNVRECVIGYQHWGVDTIVVAGVLLSPGHLDWFARVFPVEQFDVSLHVLTASSQELSRRIVNDSKIQDPGPRLADVELDTAARSIPSAQVIDTTDLLPPDVAVLILGGADLTRKGPRQVSVTWGEVQALAVGALSRVGVPRPVAVRVSRGLLDNERDGYPSHGVLRVPEYVTAVASGHISPDAVPRIHRLGNGVAVIDAQQSFGFVAADAIIAELVALLSDADVAAVGIRNCSHLGRLAQIGRSVAMTGNIVLGFANYGGAGQRVPPWGGREGRFCTNPFLFACPDPANSASPVVVDMSTSMVSEGAIRAAFTSGRSVPRGWLQDSRGASVTEPGGLYEKPPTAFMCPLGGERGFKGYGLALAAEILGGVVTGAGFASPREAIDGNGAAFIGLRPTVFGRNAGDSAANLEELFDWIRSCPSTPGGSPVRLPGQRLGTRPGQPDFQISDALLVQLARLNEE